MIAFRSRTLTAAKRNCHLHSSKLEFLALKWAILEQFRDYLYYASHFSGAARTGSASAEPHCLISYRGGLGRSLCIMGYGTQHSHSQKEHIELYNILKFGVNQTNIWRDTAIQKLKKFRKKCMERRTNRPSRPAFHTFHTPTV